MLSALRQTFKYTASYRGLTRAQRQFYEENGFIVMRNMIEPKELDVYNRRFVDICNKKINSPGILLMKDLSLLKEGKAKGEFLVYKIQYLLNDEVFFKYVSNKKIIDVVSSIVGDNVTATNSMIINKPPGSHKDSSRHPMHQDLYYFPFRPANKMCSAWTAMEKTNEENGCLFLIPGSHKWKLYPHGYADELNNKTYHEVQGFNNLEKRYLPMEKGDTVFFHPLIFHGSGPNLTKGFRKSINVHYVNSDCYFIDVKGTVQQPIYDEFNEILMKREGISYADKWRQQSRVVLGKPGKFQAVESK